MDGPIGAPRHVTVTGQIHLFRKLNIPGFVGWTIQISFSWCWIAFRRQEILIVGHIKKRRLSPLSEIIPAGNRLRRGLGATERGQKQSGENCDDGDGHQQFDQCECT